MRDRRADMPGATYFFTLNAADRGGQLLTDHIDALRDSFRTVRRSRPFVLDAICVLPDHLHLLMTLPREGADFATRIMLIKQGFSRRVPQGERISASRASKGERGLWQRRYREHFIRDDADFERHVDYIHFNPVKHGWARRAADWRIPAFIASFAMAKSMRRGKASAQWRSAPANDWASLARPLSD